MGLPRELVLPCAMENALIAAADVGLAVSAYFAARWDLVATFGLALLIEAAVLMLVGGAMEFSTSSAGRAFVSFLTRKDLEAPKERARSTLMRAATFTLVGVLLFVEALALALLV